MRGSFLFPDGGGGGGGGEDQQRNIYQLTQGVLGEAAFHLTGRKKAPDALAVSRLIGHLQWPVQWGKRGRGGDLTPNREASTGTPQIKKSGQRKVNSRSRPNTWPAYTPGRGKGTLPIVSPEKISKAIYQKNLKGLGQKRRKKFGGGSSYRTKKKLSVQKITLV